eukprot:TRINITY_DN25013_c0_g1_i1.p1 TRINITY_DN25013_c0_g1~~TRINITY_DN25013_c0_g1_i1.p1  ORF type:complete len:610 (-),score=158.18 TRINITY_DN25013_c0_g1_i1:1357-3120(-)
MDLYMSSREVQKLLGLERRISYLEDGVLNSAASQFVLPVPSGIDSLFLSWKSSSEVSYELFLKRSDPEAMYQPSVNVSHRGLVPRKEEVWRVSLPCSGLKEADVLVSIELLLSGLQKGGSKSNATEKRLRLVRKKTCELSQSLREMQGASNGPDKKKKKAGVAHLPAKYLFLRLLCVGGGIILSVLLLILAIQLRLKLKEKRHHLLSSGQEQGAIPDRALEQEERKQLFLLDHQQNQQHHHHHPLPPPQQEPLHPPPPSTLSRVYQPQHIEPFLSDAESRVTDWVQKQTLAVSLTPQDIMRTLNVDRLRLKLGQLIHEGTFGRIYQGTILLPEGGGSESDVMVKTVVSGSSGTQSSLLVTEGTSLFLNGGASTGGEVHVHVLGLLAATMDGTSPMLVYPYMSQGNLKKWLTSGIATQSTHQIVNIGLQILSALQYLHKRRVIHKDVATRNCFLNENYLIKLCDSALSRDLFPGDYHCLGDNENRPIKWMPIEAIALRKYSRASDVWSFGVFMWELMTRAQQPFADIDPFEMEGYLHEGYRLHQPHNCPDQLYSIMVLCWSSRAAERATIHALHNNMQVFQRQLQRFV